MQRIARAALAAVVGLGGLTVSAQTTTTVFFNPTQTAVSAGSGPTSETVRSTGYLLTYSQDKWWYPTISLGPGTPTGRLQSVTWPEGLDAQTVTAGPSGLLTAQVAATVTIQRADGTPFDLKSFTARLLGNTAGAGASFEIMPVLNGVDGFPDPLMFDATGYAGNTFSYPTPTLTGFDTYHISLWMDFGLTGLTLEGASLPQPTLSVGWLAGSSVKLSWPTNFNDFGLEWAASLPAPGWSPVTNSVAIEGNLFSVALEAVAGQRVFRLRSP
jgi:hypothetical protein